jgi:hypothetical protein
MEELKAKLEIQIAVQEQLNSRLKHEKNSTRDNIDRHVEIIASNLNRLANDASTPLQHIPRLLLSTPPSEDHVTDSHALIHSLSHQIDTCNQIYQRQTLPKDKLEDLQRLYTSVQLATHHRAEAALKAANLKSQIAFLEKWLQSGENKPSNHSSEDHQDLPNVNIAELEEKFYKRIERAALLPCYYEVTLASHQAKLAAIKHMCLVKDRAAQLMARQVARHELISQIQSEQAKVVAASLGTLQAVRCDVEAVVGAIQSRYQGMHALITHQADNASLKERRALEMEAIEAVQKVRECIQELDEVSDIVTKEALPALQAKVTTLLHMLNMQNSSNNSSSSSSSSRFEVKMTSDNFEKTAQGAEKAVSELRRQLTAVLSNIESKRQREHERDLPEQVYIDFFTQPSKLASFSGK